MFPSKHAAHMHSIAHPIPPVETAFPAASTRSTSMGEESAGGTAAWSAASTVPSDECGESNLLQLKDDIFMSLTLTFWPFLLHFLQK